MVRENFFDHLYYEKRYSHHTIDAYRHDLAQFSDYLSETYEVRCDADVTNLMIRSWLASLIDAGNKATSVNRKLSSVKAYFRYIQKQEISKNNPARFITSLKKPENLPSFATKKEMNIVINQDITSSFAETRDSIIIHLFYNTGIRLAELQSLSRNDIDFYSKTIKVTGKRNKQRIIPVTDELLAKLKNYLVIRDNEVDESEQALIINNKGTRISRTYIYSLVKKALTLAGVSGPKSPHVLRHTFATLMLNEGADLNAIKEILGHSSLASTQVYTYTSIEHLKSIYNQAHPWAQKKEEL